MINVLSCKFIHRSARLQHGVACSRLSFSCVFILSVLDIYLFSDVNSSSIVIFAVCHTVALSLLIDTPQVLISVRLALHLSVNASILPHTCLSMHILGCLIRYSVYHANCLFFTSLKRCIGTVARFSCSEYHGDPW